MKEALSKSRSGLARMLFANLKPLSLSLQRWMRGELPSRALPLKFDIESVSSAHPTKSPLSLFVFLHACHTALIRRNALLTLVVEQLVAVNATSMSALLRWLHVAVAGYYARPAVGIIYALYAARDENLEPDERRECLRLALATVQQLAVGYQLLLQRLRTLPNRPYALCHNKALCAGHRVMELIHAEQQLSALSRIALTERAWRNCNQLYFALNESENVTQPLPLAGYLAGPKPAAWKPKSHDEAPTHASVQQIYIALQITGMMEPTTWIPQQYSWLLAYLRRTLSRLKLRPYVLGAIENTHAVITRLQHRAPRLKTRDAPDEPALLLDVSPMLRCVQRDVARLNAGQQDTLFKRLVNIGGVSFLEQARLLEHMLSKLRFHSPRDARNHVNRYVDLELHWGFVEVFAVVKGDTPLDLGESLGAPTLDQQSEHKNAKRNTTTAHAKEWMLLNESAGGMQFRFQETRTTKPLFIGQLVAYTRGTDDLGCTVPNLAYVNRMQRGRGEVEVAMQKLAHEAECVGVQDARMQADGEFLPGLLIHCLDGKWRLLLHSKHGSYALSKLSLHSEGRIQALSLGRMYLYQPEFVVFDLEGFEQR